MAGRVPFTPRVAVRGMVCAADQLAATAAVGMLGRGGSAADAMVGAAAVMAVVGPHLCGLGGDALAMVQAPGRSPQALLAVGRAGSGADPGRLLASGYTDMPLRGHPASVPVPGAVDGWLALHGRYGRLPWATVLEPAIALAEEGFAASLILAFASHLVAGQPDAAELCPRGPLEPGERVRLPGIARTLRALAEQGRDGFYGGEFGRALLTVGDGEYGDDDLTRPAAEWVEPLHRRVFGHELWTVPPPSQGYVTIAAALLAERIGLPDDPDDPRWPYLVAEAGRAAAEDRPAVLHDGAEGDRLLGEDRLEAQLATIDPDRCASSWPSGPGADPASAPVAGSGSGSASEAGSGSAWGSAGGGGARRGPAALSADGDTTHLCVVDGDGFGISLTQSNALDFGSHLVAGATGVFLHNRGVGFSLEPGHPGRYGPGRRPSHTLSPALVTRPDGSLAQVVGTMGGDVQPQILLQLLVRTLHAGQDPARAMAAARVVHEAAGAAPFRLWHAPARTLVVEAHAPEGWRAGLEGAGQQVRTVGAFNPVDVGCAQLIAVTPAGDHVVLRGASDPRSDCGAAVGW